MTDRTEATVFVVDDDQYVRTMLFHLFKDAGLNVELHASAQEFLDSYRPERAGCLVLDVRMPGISGLAFLEQMRFRSVFLPVILFSGHADVPMVVRAFKRGAFDFVEKSEEKKPYLLQRVKQAIMQDLRAQRRRLYYQSLSKRLAQITDREWEVIDRIMKGQRNKIIASELSVSIPTVETHRKNIMEKLQAQNLSELLRMVMFSREHGQWFQRRRLEDNLYLMRRRDDIAA